MTRSEKQAIRQESTTHHNFMLDNNYGFCANCLTTENLEIHHIVPIANGGQHIMTNTVALCHACHLKAHGKLQRVSNPKKNGRKPFTMPDNADQIFYKYVHGYIGYKDLQKALGISVGTHLTDIDYYHKYLGDHHIAKVINNVERYKNPRFRTEIRKTHIAIMSVIVYQNLTMRLNLMREEDWRKKFNIEDDT